MDRCSELASPIAPRTPRDFQWRAPSGSNRTGPTDADFHIGAVHLGAHNRIGLWWDAQPNESRLSCGAKLECSQIQFYSTACKTFSGSIGDGRRQLQALVRLRTTSHSLGPSFHRVPRSARRNRPLTAIVMPNGPMLGTRQPHRLPHTTGLPVESAFRIEPNRPDGCRLDIGAVHLCVHNRIGLWWDAQPNESRLSCGALKKDSFHNLRAPSASSAC